MPRPPRSSQLLGAAALVTALVTALVGGCSLDPVQNGSIKALGDEDPNIPQGEHHRQGQPCVLCHSTTGPASDKPFAVAGTVFVGPFSGRGAGNTWVRVVDAKGTQVCKTTNCKGNFFFRDEDFTPNGQFQEKPGPSFPLLVSIQRSLPGNPVGANRAMSSHIGREGSCSGCHKPPPDSRSVASFDTPGVVRLYDTEASGNQALPPGNEACPPAEPEQLIPCPENPP